jgi:hypothetical protein
LKKQLAICAGLLLLGFGTARLAAAQAIYGGLGVADSALPPYEIMSIVRSTGLAPLTRPIRRGPYYVLVAVDRVGRQMRVVVDAQLGDIVNLRPAMAAGSYGPAVGPYGPEVARAYGPEPGRPNGLPGAAPALPDAGTAGPYGPRASGEPGAPTPPRPVPNTRALNAPGGGPAAAPAPPPAAHAAAPPPPAPLPTTRVAVAEPALPALPPPPPLPRPRPKLALNEAPVSAPPPVAAAPAGDAAANPGAGPTGAPASPVAPAAVLPSPPPNDTAEPGKQIE